MHGKRNKLPMCISAQRDRPRLFLICDTEMILDQDLSLACGFSVDEINKTALRHFRCFPINSCRRLSDQEWRHIKTLADFHVSERGNWLCAPLAFTLPGRMIMERLLVGRARVVTDSQQKTQIKLIS